jgi:TonB family protein
MNIQKAGIAIAIFSSCAAAQAQFRCDCTSIVDSCSADVAIRGSWVEVTTDQQQCARVDYFIDGQPFVAVVVDGSDRQNWIARTEDPRVMVQSCQVCRENAGAAAPDLVRPSANAPAPSAPASASAGGELQPLIEVRPAYPSTAAARGAEGYVEVEFTVSADGSVENARIAAAEPAGVFDQAALAAVNRWRYPAEPGRAAQTVKERLDFDPADAPAAAQAAAARTRSVPANAAAGPRNECVRENAVYNYGEMVEIGLMNACEEPLLVFGCAAGTGRYLGRWVCVDSGSRGSVLVPPSDRRVGDPAALAAAGARNYTYADSFFVTRAPNTQYWWVACPANDGGCLDDARQWTRSVDRQLATVDPEDRSSIAVARSY